MPGPPPCACMHCSSKGGKNNVLALAHLLQSCPCRRVPESPTYSTVISFSNQKQQSLGFVCPPATELSLPGPPNMCCVLSISAAEGRNKLRL
eukprot:scaffold73715_cov23-Tisochrysis_lutea.AAC.2